MKCCVPGCGTAQGAGISLHSFPTDGTLCSWNTFCGYLPDEPRCPNRRVCGVHFRKEDLYNIGKKTMTTAGVIPSVRIKKTPKTTQVSRINQPLRSKEPTPVSPGNPNCIPSPSRNHPEHCYAVSPGSEKRKREDDREERTMFADGAIPTR